MQNLKKSVLSGMAFLCAIGAAFALNISNLMVEPPLFREVPNSGGIMEDISTKCTLVASQQLCSIIAPSENGKYWNDAAKTDPVGGHDRTEVFVQPI